MKKKCVQHHDRAHAASFCRATHARAETGDADRSSHDLGGIADIESHAPSRVGGALCLADTLCLVSDEEVDAADRQISARIGCQRRAWQQIGV